MTAHDVKKQIEEANTLAQLWASVVCPETAPPQAQFHRWVSVFGFDGAKKAIERLSRKIMNGAMDAEYQRKYVTSVARNAKEQTEATRRKHNYPFVQDGATCSQK